MADATATAAEREPTSSKHTELLKRGLALQAQRRFTEAEFCYQSILREDPRQSDALNLMGTLALEAKRPAEAIAYISKAVEQVPGQAGYHNNLASAHLAAKDVAAAEKSLWTALRLEPDHVDALCNMGRVHKLFNRSSAALDSYRRAFELAPHLNKAMLGLADVLVDLGEMDEAANLYRRVVDTGRDVSGALVGLAIAHKFKPGDPEPELMLRWLDKAPDERRRGALHHAAGKAQADLGNFDEAFAQFTAAKALSTREFDLETLRQRHSAVIEVMTPAFFAERADFGLDTEVPVFIVGMPRSGTTLTEQICSSHSQVSGAGELRAMGDIARLLGSRDPDIGKFTRNLERMSAGQSREFATRYLTELTRFGGTSRRIIDKMPHNFELLGLIALLFPRARIIHCQRDPVDTCVSCFTHHFSESHGYNTDLHVLGLYYREYLRIVAHWRSALPLRLLESSYEELVAQQEGRSRELIGFLGLQWEDACLQFHNNDRLVKTPSRWQVRQPIYSSSVKGWQKYERHLGPLFESLGELAMR